MKISSLVLMTVTLLLTSCLEIKSTITVNKNGTAIIEENIVLGVQLASMVGGDQGGQFRSLVMTDEKAAERAKKLGEGVTVKSREEMKTADGKSGVKVVYAVADLTKLKYVPFEPEQESTSTPPTEPMTFALSGSSLTITNPEVDKKRGGGRGTMTKPQKTPEQLAMMKAQLGMMKPMLAGMHMVVEVKGADGIASSDAAYLSEGTISFMDMDLDKVMENPDNFTSFMEATNNGISIADAAVQFSKVEGLKFEGKKVVKVELK